jgi:hypothetical protein
MKHTPGPWQTIEVGEFTSKLAVADSHGVSVLTVVDEDGTKFGAVFTEEDADLIAAAPSMAEALDCIVRRLQIDVDDGSRPDQWSMEDLIRTAKAALPAGWVIGA